MKSCTFFPPKQKRQVSKIQYQFQDTGSALRPLFLTQYSRARKILWSRTGREKMRPIPEGRSDHHTQTETH
jgi:hypothetical protein